MHANLESCELNCQCLEAESGLKRAYRLLKNSKIILMLTTKRFKTLESDRKSPYSPFHPDDMDTCCCRSVIYCVLIFCHDI